MAVVEAERISLDQQFVNYAKIGEPKADGKTIKLSNIDRWLKQAEVMGKKLTMTDTGVAFNKYKVKAITYKQFVKLMEELCAEKKLIFEDVKDKLETCGIPGAKKKDAGKAPPLALPRP